MRCFWALHSRNEPSSIIIGFPHILVCNECVRSMIIDGGSLSVAQCPIKSHYCTIDMRQVIIVQLDYWDSTIFNCWKSQMAGLVLQLRSLTHDPWIINPMPVPTELSQLSSSIYQIPFPSERLCCSEIAMHHFLVDMETMAIAMYYICSSSTVKRWDFKDYKYASYKYDSGKRE